jgi:hypothetical protein
VLANTALARVAIDGRNYAFSNAPISANPELSGNATPGVSRPGWLKNVNKCNQFVGDVLFEAGFRVPVNRMSDGSVHYKLAEEFPRDNAFFDRLSSTAMLMSGDLMILDYPGRGAGSGHAEIVSGVDPWSGTLYTVGAHNDGAYEQARPGMLTSLKSLPGGRFQQGSSTVYFLRPKL